MHNDSFTHSVRPAVRRAMAPVEFVMALPVLLVLMVAMTWLGFSVIGQTEVLVEARTNAWKKRFTNASGDPLIFPVDLVIDDASLYSRDDDFVTETASKKIEVSPVFDGLPGPEASHTILAGSWDHNAMKLDKPPNMTLLATAAASGTAGKLQTWLANLKNPLGLLLNLGSQTEAQQQQQSNDFENQSKEASSTPAEPGAESETRDEAKQKTEADRAAEKKKLEERKKALGGWYNPLQREIEPLPGGELQGAHQDLDTARAELLKKEFGEKPDPDPEKEKQRQAEIARLTRKVDLLEGKLKRLESEFMDVEADLKALED